MHDGRQQSSCKTQQIFFSVLDLDSCLSAQLSQNKNKHKKGGYKKCEKMIAIMARLYFICSCHFRCMQIVSRIGKRDVSSKITKWFYFKVFCWLLNDVKRFEVFSFLFLMFDANHRKTIIFFNEATG